MKSYENKEHRGNRKTIFSICLLVLSLAGILFGIWNGGAIECMRKGMGICFECLGLG